MAKNTKGHGRATPPPEKLILDTMGAAAAWCGCSESWLKAAKKQGCKAFELNGRVRMDILVPFLIAMKSEAGKIPEGFASWKEVREKWDADFAEVRTKTAQKKVMLTDDAVRQAGEAGGIFFAELERRDRELPPALAGLDTISINKRMKSDTENIRKALKQKLSEIGK